ncbi:MAG: hypothetical protein KAX15_07190, partial [Candidatus Omnitrophica bacterium]|nr:hypothetical protein [Candidatus Omnitrophota bacterium]
EKGRIPEPCADDSWGKNICPYTKNQPIRTAPLASNLTQRFRILHPFHPLFDKQYEVLEFRRDWGKNYAAFYDENKKLVTVPVKWTDLVQEEDPFVVLSEGRAYFRPADLLTLADLIGGLKL